MSGPYDGCSLGEQLDRLNTLLGVVEHAFLYREQEQLMDGAEVCLEFGLDMLKTIREGLPFELHDVRLVPRKGAPDERLDES